MKQVLLTFTKNIKSLANPKDFYQLILETYNAPEVEVQDAQMTNKDAIVILLVKGDLDVLNITVTKFQKYFKSYSVVNEKTKE